MDPPGHGQREPSTPPARIGGGNDSDDDMILIDDNNNTTTTATTTTNNNNNNNNSGVASSESVPAAQSQQSGGAAAVNAPGGAAPSSTSMSTSISTSITTLSSSTTTAPTDTPSETNQTYEWRIPNYPSEVASCGPKKFSEAFTVLGVKWRLLLFPHGNNQAAHISVYIELLNLPANHMCSVQFKFTLLHPTNSKLHLTNNSNHEFVAGEMDRGFNQFAEIAALPNFYHAHNTLVFLIHIQPTLPELPLFRKLPEYRWANWDARKMTGYVGLKNQGATCYMNSLLQTLYHVPQFRESVFGVPVNSSTIAVALQHVFYNLQCQPSAVSTKELTKSFGWDSIEAFMQHDVQEFCRVLLDSLDLKMKGSPVEGAINRLFEGKSESFIECVNVDYKSAKVEPFLDLSLNVKGLPTLEASLDNYVASEMLDGDNQVRSDKHGKQDARKGIRILSFPPVLQLQLKRFEYDPVRDSMVKVNDRFEFPKVLDLTRFESQPVDPSDPPIYHLQSILIHAGSVHGGHYYAFVRPFKKDKNFPETSFYKFDDDDVHHVEEKETLEGSYGGEYETSYMYAGRRTSEKRVRIANAYMLVYLRQSHTVFNPSLKEDTVSIKVAVNTNDDKNNNNNNNNNEDGNKEQDKDKEDPSASVQDVPIPVRLRNFFEEQDNQVAERQKMKERAHLYTDLKLIVENDIIGKPLGIEFSVETVDQFGQIIYVPPEADLKVEKAKPVSQIVPSIKSIGSGNLQLWRFSARENQTKRPNAWLHDESQLIEQIWKEPNVASGPLSTPHKHNSVYARDLTIDDVVNSIVPPSTARSLTIVNCSNNSNEADRALMTFKFFNVRTQTVELLGSSIFLKSNTVRQLKEFVRTLLRARSISPTSTTSAAPLTSLDELSRTLANAKLDDEPIIELWEEECLRLNRVNHLDDNKTLKESQLRNGDLLIGQFRYSDADIERLRAEHEHKYEAYQHYLELTKYKSPVRTPSPSPSPAVISATTITSSTVSNTPSISSTPALETSSSASSVLSGNLLAPPLATTAAAAGAVEAAATPVKLEFHADAISYLRYLNARVVVEFRSQPWRPHPDDPNRAHSSCTQVFLELLRTNTHEEVLRRLADVLKLDWTHIRLTLPNLYNREPGLQVGRSLDTPLDDMIKDMKDGTKELLFYFQNQEFSFAELQHNRVVSIVFTDLLQQEFRFNVLVPLDHATIQMVETAAYDKLVALVNERKVLPDGGAAQIQHSAPADEVESKARRVEEEEKVAAVLPIDIAKLRALLPLRIVTIPPHICTGPLGCPEDLARHLMLTDKFRELRMDVIAPEHSHHSPGDALYWMCYFVPQPSTYNASYRAYGFPFVVVLKDGENWQDFRRRTAQRLHLPADRATKLEFARLEALQGLMFSHTNFNEALPILSQVTGGVIIGVHDPLRRHPAGASKYRYFPTKGITIKNN